MGMKGRGLWDGGLARMGMHLEAGLQRWCAGGVLCWFCVSKSIFRLSCVFSVSVCPSAYRLIALVEAASRPVRLLPVWILDKRTHCAVAIGGATHVIHVFRCQTSRPSSGG